MSKLKQGDLITIRNYCSTWDGKIAKVIRTNGNYIYVICCGEQLELLDCECSLIISS